MEQGDEKEEEEEDEGTGQNEEGETNEETLLDQAVRKKGINVTKFRLNGELLVGGKSRGKIRSHGGCHVGFQGAHPVAQVVMHRGAPVKGSRDLNMGASWPRREQVWRHKHFACFRQ